MQDQTGKTKMVADQSHKTTLTEKVERVSDAASKPSEGLTRIKTVRAIRVGEQEYIEDLLLDVSEDVAKEFCDKKIHGQMAHYGERTGDDAKRHEIVRAIRM